MLTSYLRYVMPTGRSPRGVGIVSGRLAFTAGALTILAALAFAYPGVLTTPELSAVWAGGVPRALLMGGLIATYLAALWSLIRQAKNRSAWAGLGLAGLAFLLGAPDITPRPTSAALPIGLDWLVLGALTTPPLFIAIEKWRPLRASQPVLREAWTLDGAYFVLNHLGVSVYVLAATWTANTLFGGLALPGVAAFVQGLPLYVQVPLLWLAVDFCFYWQHRAMHEVPFLWRFHAVHHSAEKMDWLASSRLHFAEVWLSRTVGLLPIIALGFGQGAVAIFVTLVSIHATLIHVNARITFGPLEHTVVSPKNHHWHHAKDWAGVDKNYAAAFAWFDRLFGTYHNPAHWPAAYGTMAGTEPTTLAGQAMHPFKRG